MDVVQKVKDLMNLALDERTPEKEAKEAGIGALRLIARYELLGAAGGKRIDVAASIIEKITSPGFAEGVATRAEKIADSVERVLGSVDRVKGVTRRSGAKRGGGRRYGGR